MGDVVMFIFSMGKDVRKRTPTIRDNIIHFC